MQKKGTKGMKKRSEINKGVRRAKEQRKRPKGIIDKMFGLLLLLSVSSLCFTIYVQESHIFPQQEGLVFEDELSDPQLEVNGQGGDSTSINVLKILEDAEAQITDEIKEKLPSDEDVEKLYGSSVRIEGLERCEVRYLGITIFPTVVHRFRLITYIS